jgi:2-desacetyl-2-hydroxyethyl bacteriochlorophyllide A dehydrogenase
VRALQIVKPYEFRIVDIPRPAPEPDEVLVELEYAAICNQNDYKILYGLYGDLIQYPCDPGVFGHEGVGIVVEAGDQAGALEVGDRVVMMTEGGPMLYMEYVTRKAGSVARIDKKVPAAEAAVLELFGCAHHCCEIAGDLMGKTVALIGLGPAGLALLQLLRLKKPDAIIGVEISQQRAAAGRELGLARIVDPSREGDLEALIEEGTDVVIDATGVPQAILNAFEITRREVIIFGFTNEKFEVDQSKWFQREMVIKNSKIQSIADLKAVVRLREEGRIETKQFIDGIMGFGDYDKAVEKVYKKEAVKILLEWE